MIAVGTGDGFLWVAAMADGDSPRGAAFWLVCEAAVGDGDPEVFGNRPDGSPGDRLEGTVLLRPKPPLDVFVNVAP